MWYKLWNLIPPTPGKEPLEGCAKQYDGEFDYDNIRESVKSQRKDEWLWLSQEARSAPALQVYSACRETAAYNVLGPRITIPTRNQIEAWRAHSTGHEDDRWLIECIQASGMYMP